MGFIPIRIRLLGWIRRFLLCNPFWCLLLLLLLVLLLLLQSISPGLKQASQKLQAIVQLLLLWSLHKTQIQHVMPFETNCSEERN